MKITKHEFRQTKAQRQRGTKLFRLTLEGKPSQDNFYKRLLFHANKLGYFLFKNHSYTAISLDEKPYNPDKDPGSGRRKSYIMRIYKKEDKTIRIRYSHEFYRMNPLMERAKPLKNGKLSNAINNENDFQLVLKMLEDRLKKQKKN